MDKQNSGGLAEPFEFQKRSSAPLPSSNQPQESRDEFRPISARYSSLQNHYPAAVSMGEAFSSPNPNRQSAATFSLEDGVHSSSSDDGVDTIHSRPRSQHSRESSNAPFTPAHRIGQSFDELTPQSAGLYSPAGSNLGQDYSRYSQFNHQTSVKGSISSFERSGEGSYEDVEPGYVASVPYRDYNSPRNSFSFTQNEMSRAATTEALLWDEKNTEADDFLHNPTSHEYKGRKEPHLTKGVMLPPDDRVRRMYSFRGLANVTMLAILVMAVLGVFACWPIANYVSQLSGNIKLVGWNIGGINATGQVPEINGFSSMIDASTPQSVMSRTGFDGGKWDLVFSDEFNTDGRTFYPGDDAYWEAVDLNYWATHNYEWCDPSAVKTKNGNLEITMTEEPIHDLNFKSGFLTSWNKFCFNDNAYIEFNVSLPGSAKAIGLWPGLWTMGNLGRAGFGATNDGTWPYSYDSCDVGTQANQTNTDGTTPVAAKSSGSHDYGGELSYLPGQKLSACTCPGDDHPGPSNSVGRGAPEIDILEAQVDWRGYGTASQSVQIAPFDEAYAWDNSTTGWTQHAANMSLNEWKGSITQESASGVTPFGTEPYDGAGYQTFGYELQGGGTDGSVTWSLGGQPTWTLNGKAFAPNDASAVGQRLISQEPMYILMNLFISSKFQGNPDFGHLKFPAVFRIDYVRVYQKTGHANVGCSPSNAPTAQYIQDHLPAYTNPNFTTWAQAGYEWPRNSRAAGGCSTKRAGP